MAEDIYAQEQRAWDLMHAGEYQESARLFKPLAALGSECARNNLGRMHWHGHLGPADRAKAIALWEQAANAGSEWATRELEDKRLWAQWEDRHRAWKLMDDGKYAESAQAFEGLAAQGSEYAFDNLGWMYSKGHLGTADLDKAISLWERAESMGSIYAKRCLGWAWKKKGDLHCARAIYLEGAELGSMPCMCRVGAMMVLGEGGAVDHDTGAAWIRRSAGSGKLFAPNPQWRLELGRSPSLVRRLRFFFWHATLLGLRRLDHGCRDHPNSL
jgi:TPR repeat protein